MNGKVNDLLDNPAGFLVDNNSILDIRMLLISQWSISTNTLSSSVLGTKGGFDFTAGGLICNIRRYCTVVSLKNPPSKKQPTLTILSVIIIP